MIALRLRTSLHFHLFLSGVVWLGSGMTYIAIGNKRTAPTGLCVAVVNCPDGQQGVDGFRVDRDVH